MIWKTALEAEASARIVPLFRVRRTIPQKRLASPLLSTCRESRWYALRFYSIKLTVYRIPKELRVSPALYLRLYLYRLCWQPALSGPLYDTLLQNIDFTEFFLHQAPVYSGPGQRTTTYVSAPMDVPDCRLVRNVVSASCGFRMKQTVPSMIDGMDVMAYDIYSSIELWGTSILRVTKGWKRRKM
ncbi:hypothetical protein PG994_003104 [Apiospora phragmitis]|uniref:Uncharacterized protein n=1 Tax=Apiospora phragmitis TaxID=2905665 RepID=A0ABR1W8C1_9PEZI